MKKISQLGLALRLFGIIALVGVLSAAIKITFGISTSSSALAVISGGLTACIIIALTAYWNRTGKLPWAKKENTDPASRE